MSIRDRFVQETLRSEGERMLKRQGEAMRTAVRFRTNSLYANRTVSVSGGEYDGNLTFSHSLHERFLDLKTLRHGSVTVKRKKSRRIHNRFVWGMYNSIVERLLYGFTEEVAESLRKMFPED